MAHTAQMRRGPCVLHVASLVAGVSLGLGCAAATAVSPTVDRAGDSILFIGNSLTASYRAAAEANDALLLPAGDAWTIVGARDSSMILVGPDGFHPSVLGTYAAALTVACALLPPDRPSLARAVSASGLRLDVARRDLLVDAACTAATARH